MVWIVEKQLLQEASCQFYGPILRIVADTSDMPRSDTGNYVALCITGAHFLVGSFYRGPKDHANIRILPTMVSANRLVLGLRNYNVGSLCLCGLWGP